MAVISSHGLMMVCEYLNCYGLEMWRGLPGEGWYASVLAIVSSSGGVQMARKP